MPSSATTLRLEEIAEQMETVAIATCMTVPVETGRRLVGLLTDRDVRRLQASDISALAVYE
jgi:CBS domain-containing protein